MRFATQPFSRSSLGRSASVDQFVGGGESRPLFSYRQTGSDLSAQRLGWDVGERDTQAHADREGLAAVASPIQAKMCFRAASQIATTAVPHSPSRWLNA